MRIELVPKANVKPEQQRLYCQSGAKRILDEREFSWLDGILRA